jgi:hypothetical protein
VPGLTEAQQSQTGGVKLRCLNRGLRLALAYGLMAFVGLTAQVGLSQTPADKSGPDSPVAANPCRIEVAKFERAMGFVRQASGNEFAAKIKEALLPAKTEADILMREGYCGLAKYMRDNKLLDKVR